jgi:septal ring factor EnvC (AmiA/AmiB activator)
LTAFLLAVNDPTTQQGMEKAYELIIAALTLILVVANKWTRTHVVKAIKKWLTDDAIIEQQKKITEDIKQLVEMQHAAIVQLTQTTSTIDKLREAVKELGIDFSELKKSEDALREKISDIRERIAKLEARQ